MLEIRIKEVGVEYEKVGQDWGEKFVVDGKFIMGQNFVSVKVVGEVILKVIQVVWYLVIWFLSQLYRNDDKVFIQVLVQDDEYIFYLEEINVMFFLVIFKFYWYDCFW